MSNINDDDIDDKYCPICKEITKQEFHSAGHERDSSYDYYHCLKCDSYAFGMTGYKYNPPSKKENNE